MLEFLVTSNDDLSLLKEWIAADEWHSDPTLPCQNPAYWLTGVNGSYLASRLVDELGTVLFFKFDVETTDCLRLHTQFGPVSDVSERRVAKAILEGLQRFSIHASADGFTSIVTESISPRLVSFLKKMGFTDAGKNDYRLDIAAKEVAA
jgi:hypothetical protein